MAITLADTDKMIQVSKEEKVNLGVIFQTRYVKGCMEIKKAILDGKLGRILSARSYLSWMRDEGYYAEDAPIEIEIFDEKGKAGLLQDLAWIELKGEERSHELMEKKVEMLLRLSEEYINLLIKIEKSHSLLRIIYKKFTEIKVK